MLVVGYGADVNEIQYAIVKNQWGTTWGQSGYAFIALTNDTVGTCGLYLRNYQTFAGF